jgi:DNA mismatch repair ATPase MutL
MEFNHDGSLDSDSIVSIPRKVGTTVAVLKLLNSLPVRRADMQRRIVHHRSKLMSLMEGCKYNAIIASMYLLLTDTHSPQMQYSV